MDNNLLKPTIMKDKIILSSAILALGIIILGVLLKAGIDDFTNKDRKVTVKGLSERIVPADKVTWPIATKEIGNDLPQLYQRIGKTQSRVKSWLEANGIKDSEIQVNAPTVIDLNAEQYGDQNRPYRYNVTCNLTVTSKNVNLVRSIMAKQGDLLKEGIAIVSAGYDNTVKYEYEAFKDMKPKMMEEAIANAEKTASQFAKNSHSKLNKIVSADQGQFSINNRDDNTPYIKKVRVVTTITYSLKD
jgi:hypothetical protein